jgi:hypothetical protein
MVELLGSQARPSDLRFAQEINLRQQQTQRDLAIPRARPF